jgi:hypothetical protein
MVAVLAYGKDDYWVWLMVVFLACRKVYDLVELMVALLAY